MKLKLKLTTLTLSLSLSLPLAAAAIFDVPGYLVGVDRWLSHPSPSELNDVFSQVGGLCIVQATGGDDTAHLHRAVERCGDGGVVILPSKRYTLHSPLSWNLKNTVVTLKGALHLDPKDPDEIADNAAVLSITGHDWVLSGGEIETAVPGLTGLALRDAHDASVNGLRIRVPGGVGVVVEDTRDTALGGIEVITDTDGDIDTESIFDDMTVDSDVVRRDIQVSLAPSPVRHSLAAGIILRDSRDIAITHLHYTGAGECLSLTHAREVAAVDVKCEGAGINIGAADAQSGENEILRNIALVAVHITSTANELQHGIHFRSFADVGDAHNISVSHALIEDVAYPVRLQHLPNALVMGADFAWSHVNLTNITGTSTTNRLIWLDCDPAAPCTKWRLEDIDMTPGQLDRPELNYICNHFEGLLGDVDCCEEDEEDEEGEGVEGE